MAEAHSTTTPKQVQTDTFAVFADQSAQLDPHEDLVLIARVEVPRYSQPDDSGTKLNRQKRLTLAVHRAVERRQDIPPVEGFEYMVMTDLEDAMAFVEYEENPAFDGVWNPEESDE